MSVSPPILPYSRGYEAIRRKLLQTRPKVLGIAAPGMPAGSPGMEVPGGAVAPYDVIAFDAAGKTRVFASHR
jgi:hypothetical protein